MFVMDGRSHGWIQTEQIFDLKANAKRVAENERKPHVRTIRKIERANAAVTLPQIARLESESLLGNTRVYDTLGY